MSLLAGAFALVQSGCVVNRQVAFAAPPGPLALPLSARAIETRWALGEVWVRPQITIQAPQDWSRGRAQVEEHVRQTLLGQTGLGRRTDDRASADFVVDVEIAVQEQTGVNGWLAGAIGVGVASMGVGGLAGAGIARATGGDAGAGALIGTLAAEIPGALLGVLLPGATDYGTFDATLTVRRAADGVVVRVRHARAEWTETRNAYFVESKLAASSGAAASVLEQRMIEELHRTLAGLEPAKVAEHTARTYPADAPRL